MDDFFDIRTFGDPVLTERSLEVDSKDEELAELFATMLEKLEQADGVGLAAPQVGVLKRVILVEFDEEAAVYLNPRITKRSQETCLDGEGCLSIPGIRVQVPRHESIRLEAEDRDGESMMLEAEGLQARIFQHEIDHLDGVLILDRTSKEDRRRALQEMGLLPGGPVRASR